ncbi:hypothetical protein ACQP2K_10620 [Microbispora siamensis]
MPLLGRGSRADLDLLPRRFPTRVPRMLGLPGLLGNLAEGTVLRPDVPLAPERRPAVKVKIEEFDERRFVLVDLSEAFPATMAALDADAESDLQAYIHEAAAPLA